ncbi:MAG: MFS transporter [Paracoccaceae bacterium]
MYLTEFLRANAPWLTAGALLTFMSGFGQTYFISIFAGEIRAEFDLSHGQWGGIYSLGTTTSAIVMVWAGGLTDRFRARGLGAITLLALAFACIAMATVSAVWALPFVIFALRFTGQGMASHIAVVAMARWFVATRGRALSIASLGFSIGEALLPIIFVTMLALVDWRLLWLVAAGISVLGLPVLSLLLRNERTPQSMAHENSSVGMGGRQWTRAQALRHPLLWFIVPAILGQSAFNTAFFFQQVHFAEIKGMEHLQLVALFPFYTLFGIGAMLVSGWALDKFGTARLMPLYQLPMVAAFVVFAMTSSIPFAVLGFFFLALSAGANSTLPNAFWAEFYGTQHIGSIKAAAIAVMVLGSAIGPGITGVLIDAGVGLETQYLGVSFYFVVSTLMMMIGIGRARSALPA